MKKEAFLLEMWLLTLTKYLQNKKQMAKRKDLVVTSSPSSRLSL